MVDNQKNRPNYIEGYLEFAGRRYKFASGSSDANHPSIPYGDYPITPRSIGPWGKAHGALGINNDKIWDPKINRYRTGIELHPVRSYHPLTAGCVGIIHEEWPQLRAAILAQVAAGDKLYLHVSATRVCIDTNAS